MFLCARYILRLEKRYRFIIKFDAIFSMQVKMMRQRLVRKTFEMIERIAKDEDKQVL